MFEIPKRDLRELDKIERYLNEKGIPYTRDDVHPVDECRDIGMDWHQILVPNRENPEWDVICHFGSYGCDLGLLEAMWSNEEPIGYLTAEQLIEIIESRCEND